MQNTYRKLLLAGGFGTNATSLDILKNGMDEKFSQPGSDGELELKPGEKSRHSALLRVVLARGV